MSPRPQEPVPPLPYDEEEVRLSVAEPSVTLAGTLTRPRSGAPGPAILLVNGSGVHDRDEALCGHRPFLVLADHLTRSGFVVLRLDDRGAGGSTGDKTACGHEELLGDVELGLKFLTGHSAVDVRRVGLLGHSEGASLAAAMAQRSAQVSFLVLLGCATGRGTENIHEQSALICAQAGATPEQIAHERRMNEAVFAILQSGGPLDDEAARAAVRPIFSEALQTWPGGVPIAADELGDHVEGMVDMVVTRDFRSSLGCDFGAYLTDLRCPVLALYGSLDLQVPPAAHLPRLRAALAAAGNPRAVVEELPGLNHLFQTARTGAPSEYEEIEETLSPVVLQRISGFISALRP